jgi:WD40 repeat protein
LPGERSAAEVVYRVQTDGGELTITTLDADVEVVIKQNGSVVRVVDAKTKKEVAITSGRFEAESTTKPDGLRLSLDRVTIYRGDTAVATVERHKKPSGDPPAEIVRDAFDGETSGAAHIYRVSFSPNGRYFVAGGDAGDRSPVRIYDAKTGKLVSQFTPESDAGWSCGRFSPDSSKVVSCWSGSTKIYVWDSATGRQLLKLEGHKEPVHMAAFSPDGKRIVSGSADHTLRVWDATTGKELLTLAGHDEDCIGCFSPDGKRIVSSGLDKTIRGWDAASGKELWKMPDQAEAGHHNFLHRLETCFSADGNVLSIGVDGNVQVLEVATGKTVATVKSPMPTQGAVFVRNGQQLVWWDTEKRVRVWDMTAGKVTRTVEPGEDLKPEPDNVAVSLNGRLLVTGHSDLTVRIFDLNTGKELHRFETAPRSATRSIAISPDGHFAAAGSFRGWIYLWRLPVAP